MAPEQTARFERKKEMRHGDADAFSLSYLLKKPEERAKRSRKSRVNYDQLQQKTTRKYLVID